VHQARVVGDHGATGGNQDNRLLKLGFSRQVAAPCLLFVTERREDFIACLVVFCRTEQDYLVAFVNQLFRQLRLVFVRPAFCRAELGAGAEANHRAF
jgi:hypothetical protein